MMNHTRIGIDLAKNIFHLVELDAQGKPRLRKKLTRTTLSRYFQNKEPTLIAMEACSSAHHWARLFQAMGHHVELLAPRHVKAYLRGQKNDYNDALAIAEASRHGALRPVPVKTIPQQDVQALHRMRQQCVSQRTRLVNQMRGLLGEYGICIPQGVHRFQHTVPALLEDPENALTSRFRALLDRTYQRLRILDQELRWFDSQLQEQVKQDEVCQRLLDVPGFGVVVSSALRCWMGDGHQFRRGREASAALGLVPRQHSSAAKERLLGITKRGDTYTRYQVINGARAVVMHAKLKSDKLSAWIRHLLETRGFNKTVVAVANKLLRIAWVIIARGESYRPHPA